MTVSYELLREVRVVLQIYRDPLDMGEIIRQQQDIMRHVLDRASKPVHSIVDLSTVIMLPSNILSQSVSSLRTVHPNGGEIVIVSTSTFLNTMSNIFKKAVR